MSRMATNEYIGAKRRAYALADRAKRMRILDNEAKMQEKVFLPSRIIPPWRFAPPLRGRLGFPAKEGITPQLTNTKPSQRSEN